MRFEAMRFGVVSGGFALALCLAVPGTPSAAAANEASVPGCTVRLVGVDERSVPSFRGECVWSLAPAWVAGVLTDPARHYGDSTLLRSSRLLDDGRIVNLQKTGWPFEDRQSTIVVEDEPLPGGGLRHRYRLADEQAPLADGAVQVAVDEGFWEVAPHPDGVRVVLEMVYAPGGNLPTGLVHAMSPKYIAKGLDELRTSAEKLASEQRGLPDVASGPPATR